MSGAQILGALLILAFFAFFFGAMIWAGMGWRLTVFLWALAIGMTAVMATGVFLLTGEL